MRNKRLGFSVVATQLVKAGPRFGSSVSYSTISAGIGGLEREDVLKAVMVRLRERMYDIRSNNTSRVWNLL